jgi:hypothetical protein
MPAYTVAQLEEQLGSYVAPNTEFRACLAQMLPRLYNLGMWRDLVYEISLSGKYGYITLPPDVDSVIACTINDNPRPVRSFWHDVKIVGRNPVLSPFFGIVDDGFHPVALDMKDVQGVDSEDETTIVQLLFAAPAGGDPDYFINMGTGWASEPQGRIRVTALGDPELGNTVSTEETEFLSNHWLIQFPDGFFKVVEIRYDGLAEPVDIYCSHLPLDYPPIATLPAGSGVYRARRFRISDAGEDTTVHLTVKRAVPSDLSDDNTIVHLGNLSAIKHALLCLIAEDNADMERAEYHWSKVREMLDEELDTVRGSARPSFPLDVWGNVPKPYSLY